MTFAHIYNIHMERGQFQQLRGMLSIVLATSGRLEEGLTIDRQSPHLSELCHQLEQAVDSLEQHSQMFDRLLQQHEQILHYLEEPVAKY